jgi:hypothetical protein
MPMARAILIIKSHLQSVTVIAQDKIDKIRLTPLLASSTHTSTMHFAAWLISMNLKVIKMQGLSEM